MTNENKHSYDSFTDIFEYNDQFMNDDDDNDNPGIKDKMRIKQFNMGIVDVSEKKGVMEQSCNGVNKNQVKGVDCEVIVISDDTSSDREKLTLKGKKKQIGGKLPISTTMKDLQTNTKQREEIVNEEKNKGKAKTKKKEKRKEKESEKTSDVYASIQQELQDISYNVLNEIKIDKMRKEKERKDKELRNSVAKQNIIEKRNSTQFTSEHLPSQQNQFEYQQERPNKQLTNSQAFPQEIEKIDLRAMAEKVRSYYPRNKKGTKQLNKIIEVGKLFDCSKDLITNWETIFDPKNELTIQMFQTGFEYYAALYFQLQAKLQNSTNKVLEIINYDDIHSIELEQQLNKKKLKKKKEKKLQYNLSNKDKISVQSDTTSNKQKNKNKSKDNKDNKSNRNSNTMDLPCINLSNQQQINQVTQAERNNSFCSDKMIIENDLYKNKSNYNIVGEPNINSISFSTNITEGNNTNKTNNNKQIAIIGTNNVNTMPNIFPISNPVNITPMQSSITNCSNNHLDIKKKQRLLQNIQHPITELSNIKQPNLSLLPLKTKAEIDQFKAEDPIYSIIKEKINGINNNEKEAIEYLELALPHDKVEIISNIKKGKIHLINNDQPVVFELYRHDYFISQLIYMNYSFSINETYLNLQE